MLERKYFSDLGGLNVKNAAWKNIEMLSLNRIKHSHTHTYTSEAQMSTEAFCDLIGPQL